MGFNELSGNYRQATLLDANGGIYVFLGWFFQSWSRPCRRRMVTNWPSHDHYQWWNLPISEIVLPVMRPTMQDAMQWWWLSPDQHMISQPRSQNHIFWSEMWLEGWLHARKICAINLKMFEMQYSDSVCIWMSLLSYYHLDWNRKQWKKVKTVKKK